MRRGNDPVHRLNGRVTPTGIMTRQGRRSAETRHTYESLALGRRRYDEPPRWSGGSAPKPSKGTEAARLPGGFDLPDATGLYSGSKSKTEYHLWRNAVVKAQHNYTAALCRSKKYNKRPGAALECAGSCGAVSCEPFRGRPGRRELLTVGLAHRRSAGRPPGGAVGEEEEKEEEGEEEEEMDLNQNEPPQKHTELSKNARDAKKLLNMSVYGAFRLRSVSSTERFVFKRKVQIHVKQSRPATQHWIVECAYYQRCHGPVDAPTNPPLYLHLLDGLTEVWMPTTNDAMALLMPRPLLLSTSICQMD
ncbi:hypothetical protein EYF80_026275 [Liparis tanakae]|uniref:Uncharacterized protein n=1 Tax=Liparis tanakae TaxID=230148 RepID=A0A4Z2HEW7_9TELE|nr:hypothetical protein EYF80_026275 [Liparis tanakae]